MTTQEKAAKEWQYKSNRRWYEKESNSAAFDDPYIKGIEDFKASLREAIKKKKKYHNQAFGQDIHITIAFDMILELLDTIEPIKP